MQKIQWFTAGGGGGGGTSYWTADGDNIYNNNSGFVGIGTDTPLQALHVVGKAIVDSGSNNLFIGDTNTGSGITSGQNSIGIGPNALRSVDSTTQYAVAIGSNAGRFGTNNHGMSIGFQAGYNGAQTSTYVGSSAGQNAAGQRNVGIGYRSGGGNSNGVQSLYGNVSIGYEAGLQLETAATAVGYQALTALTTGVSNTAVGYLAGSSITSSSYNTVVGYEAGRSQLDHSTSVTALGYRAGYSTTRGGIFIGVRAGENTNNSSNVFIGDGAGQNVTLGNSNVGVGNGALRSGGNGAGSVALGANAGRYTQSGGNTLIGFNAGYGVAGSSFSNTVAVGYEAGCNLTEGSGNVLLGYQAGRDLTSERDLLYIANSSTNTPLVYGQFPNTLLRVNAPLEVFGVTNVVGNTTVKGQFEVERSDSTTNLLTVADASLAYRIAGNNTSAQVTIDRDGSTSGDVVALKVGSNITIKRNGGGTPAFTVGNAGFIYTQTYNGDTVGNTNPFNNGAGMGVRNSVQGSKVILALFIKGVFGALNTAGATLEIGNPHAANANWTSDHATHFRNANRFEIDGANTTASEEKRYIFRYNRLMVASDPDDYRLGVQISGMANQQLGTSNNTQCTMTNGSNVVTLTTGTLRSWATVGTAIYFNDSSGGTFQQISSSSVKYTITSILSTTSFTISGVWTGDDGINVYAFLEPYSLTIRNWNKDVLARWKPDGQFEVGTTNISGSLDVTEAISYQITDVTHSSASEYLVGSTEYIVFNTWTGVSGQAFIRLPLVADSEGRVLRFKSDGTINNTDYVTITPNTSDTGVTIDGVASFDLDRDYDGIMLLCHNSNWFVIQRKSK